MISRASSFWGILVLVALFFLPHTAHAWVETTVRSHQAHVLVNEDGSAIVRHELVLKVRGGPMKALEIDGIGSSIEPLPDALVRRAVEGSASVWPLTVSALEGGGLRLSIGAERGIRGGSYLFSFAYSVDLNDLGRISAQKDGVVISWIGPRLSSGVDSAKVIFVTPRGKVEPRLPSGEEAGSVLLGEVRRGAEFDEIELVRAHLATGEPALWRVLVSPEVIRTPAFDQQVTGLQGEDSSAGARYQSPTLGGKASAFRGLWVAGLGTVFGVLVFLKAWWLRRAAELLDVRNKALIPCPPALRAILSGALVSGCVWFALSYRPWLSVGFLALAVVFSTHLLPVRRVRPRGPGHWEKLEDLREEKANKLPGRLFETRSLPGFLFFCLLSFPILKGAHYLLPLSNYLALMVAGSYLLLLPLFWTGRLVDLPQSSREQVGTWLKFLTKALDPTVATVEPWGRRAIQGDSSGFEKSQPQADEIRLRILLKKIPLGLRAMEVSFDESAGSTVLPCVILRVLDDSPTLDGLPKEIVWQRGRTQEEKVALLRPAAPTRAQLLRLVRTLLSSLRATAQRKGMNTEAKVSQRGAGYSESSRASQLSRRAHKSAGNSDSTRTEGRKSAVVAT